MHEHISEDDLERVIPAFYTRVRDDALIGPVFNAAIDDWPHHLEKLVAFWSSVMRSTGRYKGSPMAAHQQHRGRITREMFTRWLALWGEVTGELLSSEGAAAMQAKAATIAESLQGYTMLAAQAAWRSEETGSLSPGKSGDLIVIDRDLFACDPQDISETQVDVTIFRGNIVHGNG